MSSLRPYQIEDVNFLTKFNTAGCFNEQRTGKTPTVLKVLEQKHCQKVLIICPASAIYQWSEEYVKWINQPCMPVTGSKSQKDLKVLAWQHGLVVSYDSLKPTQRSDGLLDLVLSMEPDAVILDEAHRIKDSKSAAARAAFKLMAIPTRYALTGTPSPNKREEVYPILYWLFPKDFPSYWNFVGEYFHQYRRSAGSHSFIDIGDFKKGKEEQLQNYLAEHTTQRKRKEVMPWLPEKDYTRIKLPCTKEQQKYLSELSDFFETETVVTQGILDRLIRYRQICLHPALLNLKGTSPKLDWLKDYMQDYPNTSTIIFTKFTSFIKILEKELNMENVGVIIGDTPIQERNEIKNSFQNGDIKFLLLNIDAGKESLTLDKAETTIFLDKYPPVGDIMQAEDRFVSTTEDKADKPHHIVEVMMKDTYDEALYELLEKRFSEVDVINDYRKYIERRNTNVRTRNR